VIGPTLARTFRRATRGTGQHAQLIGGEVSLLAPEDHARALEIMREHGRKPISMTHGDFDYEHLRRLAVASEERRRLPHTWATPGAGARTTGR
jgi:hypothetical protein